MYSTISMTCKQLYHILDYEQHLSCGGTNGCGICYKKRRKKFKHALSTQIAIHLNFFGLINTFPPWCIANHEMNPLACVNSQLDRGGRFAPGRRFAPCYSICRIKLSRDLVFMSIPTLSSVRISNKIVKYSNRPPKIENEHGRHIYDEENNKFAITFQFFQIET